MARMFNFLGQKIVVGEIVGDIANNSNRLNYVSSPTYFDPIEYMRRKGGIPRTDTSYSFYDPGTEDNDPVFQFTVLYTGSTFRVGYKFRWYDHGGGGGWDPWPVTAPLVMNWGDGYSGVDPDDIQEEDGWRNGMYLTYVDVSTMPDVYNYGVGAWGFCLGHEDQQTTVPTAIPKTGAYELDEDQTPPRYVYLNIGDTYTFFDWSGQQIALPRFGRDCFMLLMEEIDGSTSDDSSPAGGGGTYSFPTWDVPIGDLPSISIIDSGIATMWTPSPGQMQGLVSFLWSSSFWTNIIKNCDPIDNIIQFGIVPINLQSYEGTAKNCKVGNVDTGVSMTPLTQQYITYDCGKVKIPEAWGSCIDYSLTKISCYAPYVGTFDLDPSEVMNAEYLQMIYKIDLLSGDFVMLLICKKMMPAPMNRQLNSVLYHKPGNLMTKIPMTGANYSKMYSQILQGVAQGFGSAMTGNIGGVASAVAGIATSPYTVQVERSGAYTGASAILGVEYPHLILSQPIQSKPKNYGSYEGFACNVTYKLNDLHGFTKVEALIDNTIPGATEKEKAEIEQLLKEGIFLP